MKWTADVQVLRLLGSRSLERPLVGEEFRERTVWSPEHVNICAKPHQMRIPNHTRRECRTVCVNCRLVTGEPDNDGRIIGCPERLRTLDKTQRQGWFALSARALSGA
jgi:hypothetical protein